MNDKSKFATKVALSLTLAYLIPFSMGWPQAATAATTVMLIASTGSRRESLAKGTLRVLGTLVGAVIGLLLVGMFAQDRIMYMLSVSVVVSFIFYFRNAYQKDPTSLALTGVMTLMSHPDTPIDATVDSIGWGIAPKDGTVGYNLLPNVNPVFQWIRLAQHIPVRVSLHELPEGVDLRFGISASIMVMKDSSQEQE